MLKILRDRRRAGVAGRVARIVHKSWRQGPGNAGSRCLVDKEVLWAVEWAGRYRSNVEQAAVPARAWHSTDCPSMRGEQHGARHWGRSSL